jgi:hypothetical protein
VLIAMRDYLTLNSKRLVRGFIIMFISLIFGMSLILLRMISRIGSVEQFFFILFSLLLLWSSLYMALLLIAGFFFIRRRIGRLVRESNLTYSEFVRTATYQDNVAALLTRTDPERRLW